jgi:hypothetical protein
MQRLKRTPVLSGAFASLVTLFCLRNNSPTHAVENLSNAVILQWNEVAYDAFGGPTYQHSLMASRINAMTHIAMHDALNAVQPRFSSYAFRGHDAKADPIAAAASAAYTVLLHEIPARKSFLDSALKRSLEPITRHDARTRGIALGSRAAQAIIALRDNDGSAADPIAQVPATTRPGSYRAVPPFNILFASNWNSVKPFGLARRDQFRCEPPPALNSDIYGSAFNEVKETGKPGSKTRTADQTAYAKFWYEFSEAGWNRVARIVAANKKLNLFETARLFALVDIAIADSYIAGWDSKFHYNFWRPYTAIRLADTDDNDNTGEDTRWESLEPTPPVQDYPSTHSALGNAGATVLAMILGDTTSFAMISPTAVPAGTWRRFNSFSQAANENADSRVRAGIHFRFSCDAGQVLGSKIGKWTVENHLQPLN